MESASAALAADRLPGDSACSAAWPVASPLETCSSSATSSGCFVPDWTCACDHATRTAGSDDPCCRSHACGRGFARTCPTGDRPCTGCSSYSSTCHACPDRCDDHRGRASKNDPSPGTRDRSDCDALCPCACCCFRNDRANCSDRDASPDFSSCPSKNSHAWTPTDDPAMATRISPSGPLSASSSTTCSPFPECWPL